MILKSFQLGGAEKQALNLASYLIHEKKCKVLIYSYLKAKNDQTFLEEMKKLKISTTNLQLIKNPLSASGKFKYLKIRCKLLLLGLTFRKHNPYLIIPYLNNPSVIAGNTYRLSGAKFSFWNHRGYEVYRNDLIEQKAVQKMKCFIANSTDGVAELKEKFKIKKEQIFCLPNIATMKAQEKKLKNTSKKVITIGMIGHFREEKLQLLVVKTFIDLLQEYKNIQLLLVGDVPDSKEAKRKYKEITSLISKEQFANNITILHNTLTIDIINTIDIGILISKKEGMPNVVMEYMTNELPVVSTKHAGCIQMLGEDYPYFVENKKNDIYSKLSILIENKKLRDEIGNKNKKRIEDHFSIDTFMNSLEDILNRINK